MARTTNLRSKHHQRMQSGGWRSTSTTTADGAALQMVWSPPPPSPSPASLNDRTATMVRVFPRTNNDEEAAPADDVAAPVNNNIAAAPAANTTTKASAATPTTSTTTSTTGCSGPVGPLMMRQLQPKKALKVSRTDLLLGDRCVPTRKAVCVEWIQLDHGLLFVAGPLPPQPLLERALPAPGPGQLLPPARRLRLYRFGDCRGPEREAAPHLRHHQRDGGAGHSRPRPRHPQQRCLPLARHQQRGKGVGRAESAGEEGQGRLPQGAPTTSTVYYDYSTTTTLLLLPYNNCYF
eukprot:8761822-Pyramimonas_sp.AAC.1